MQHPYAWLLALALLAPTRLLAQKPKALVIPADTLYFDQDWERTTVPEDAKYARLVRHDLAGKPVGTVRDFYYPGWKKQWEGKLLSETPDVSTGICTYWHENGQMASRATYVQGKPQADMQQWNESGKLVACKLAYQELPTATAPTKLHSRMNSGESSTVYTIDLPANQVGLFYALDIRDEGEPTISLATAASLAATALTATTTGGMSLMAAAAKAAMNFQQAEQVNKPASLSNCRYLVTTDLATANFYKQYKGRITHPELVSNRPAGSGIVGLPAGCRRVYVCVSNDNDVTVANAQLVVKTVATQCE